MSPVRQRLSDVMSADRASDASRVERERRTGRIILATAVIAFIGIALPLVWRGAPVADDFNNCMASADLGVGGFIRASWQQLGAIRPARVLEILLAAGVCHSLPFGFAIIVPLALSLSVAFLTRALLRELDVPVVWANIGGALWLLQPLGTEAGLWPAALHVPLGLALTLQALRWYRRGMYAWGALANLAAAMSIEQVVLAIPLAAALVTHREYRKRAVAVSGVVAAVVIAGVMMWPGANPRLRASLTERIGGLTANPAFYVAYPAVGLGLHSVPLALRWAWPWDVPLIALAGIAGWRIGPRLTDASRMTGERHIRRLIVGITALVVLTNVVVVLAVPQQGSPRVFAPTWLVLAAAAAIAGSSIRWRRPRLLGVLSTLFAACALLSLMFSVFVRLRSSDFTQRAAGVVAARVAEGGSVAICDVRRTVVQPAPRGAFAVHEFIYEWAAERALQYYTGRHATIYLAGELWTRPCPPVPNVDAVIGFDELLAAAHR
jgi:hypothetical protein